MNEDQVLQNLHLVSAEDQNQSMGAPVPVLFFLCFKVHKPYLFLILSIFEIIFKIKNCFYLKDKYIEILLKDINNQQYPMRMCFLFSLRHKYRNGIQFQCCPPGDDSIFWGLHFLSIVVYWDLGLCSWNMFDQF